jgi:ApaG protein
MRRLARAQHHGAVLRGSAKWSRIAAMADRKHEVKVSARTAFIPEQSDVNAGRYVFAYTITVLNTGSVTAQLPLPALDHHGLEQPGSGSPGQGRRRRAAVLKPNESFEYTSGTAIATPVGTMRGSYQMRGEDGVEFDAPIPEFTLSMPRVLH